MTLEQLRIFIAVAEREHVTQAAKALNLTQSATSAAIAALEHRHATRLFDRIGRRVALTEAGRVFLDEARAVLARAVMAEAALADLAGLKRGAVNLAASQTIGNYWLPKFICRFAGRHPGVALSLSIDNTQRVAALVREGGVDLGFVEGNIDDPALAIEAVDDDELVIVAACGRGIDTSAAGLRAARWVVRERGSGTREIFEAALPGLGVDPKELQIVLELPSNEAVRAAVETGAGAAALSRLVVENALKAKVLEAATLALPARRFFALRLKERRQTAASAAFLEAILEARSQSAAIQNPTIDK